jgi:spermidine/putrescine transport system ATP-binding protein
MADAQPSPDGGGAIELVALRKEFDGIPAVDGIDLSIASGEFFALLGPSGCGKTTTLRMIAGFEQPTDGQVLLDGVDLSQTAPNKRPVNTVFQSYALFPHLSVQENVGYGLRWMKGLSKADKVERVREALEQVRLIELAERRPGQMSGGQQQRVALARALVLKPKCLLLDEPLGALDAKLRKELRTELTSVHRDVGITFLLVTHDQEEALEMSDRLAVMNEGLVAQYGTPKRVYEAPDTEFVADFLGAANVLEVTVGSGAAADRQSVTLGAFEILATGPEALSPGPGKVVIRPERVVVTAEGQDRPDSPFVNGIVDDVVYVGPTTQARIRLPHGPAIQALIVNAEGASALTSGTAVTVSLQPEAVRLLKRDPDRHQDSATSEVQVA